MYLYHVLKWARVLKEDSRSWHTAVRNHKALPRSTLSLSQPQRNSFEAKTQKIRFLLGVFDENDDRCFDENEFVQMIQALLRGMGAMLLSCEGSHWTWRHGTCGFLWDHDRSILMEISSDFDRHEPLSYFALDIDCGLMMWGWADSLVLALASQRRQ